MKKLFRKRRRQVTKPTTYSFLRGMIRTGLLLLTTLVLVGLNFYLYGQSTMPGFGLRYLCIPPAILLVLLVAGTRYIQVGYGLRGFGAAQRYLFANLISMGFPTLLVSAGKARVKPDRDNLIASIGGPGYLVVQPGNVALIENLAEGPRVVGAGRHFLSRLETLKEVRSLEERKSPPKTYSAMSKDGIEVKVQDVRYRYRLARDLDPEGGSRRTLDDPHPFSEEAVINMTYNRNVTDTGVATWDFGVNNIVDTVITDYIREHHVDHLTAPSTQKEDPRGGIVELISSEEIRDKFRSRGAELLWIDIGHFEAPEKLVGEQHRNAWMAEWSGRASVARAFGESQRLAYRERGRAEAQADMLKSIVKALEDVGIKGDARQHKRAIYLARIAQLLDAMGKGS